MTRGSDAGTHCVALLGNPNTGKTTVFNKLTGYQARTGNYPGVTVDVLKGDLKDVPGVQVIDLPGTYSLAARSPDEMIAVDVLLGHRPDIPKPDAVVVVVDAANLERNLYLVTQTMELGIPTLVALNMIDTAKSRLLAINMRKLARILGIPVIPCVANQDKGTTRLKVAIQKALDRGVPPEPPCRFPTSMHAAEGRLREDLAAAGIPDVPEIVCRRTLLDFGGEAEQRLVKAGGYKVESLIQHARETACPEGNGALYSLEAETRYAYIDGVSAAVLERPPGNPRVTASDRIDHVLTHRLFGTGVFVLVMGMVFVSIFEWAAPVMHSVDSGFASLGSWVHTWGFLGSGALKSLVVDGVIAGVGAILIFLPQILILFGFITILEDCGYMARVAFLMDRLLRWCGLSGKSFIPMLSSFACAVPGLMAARTLESRQERLVTNLVSPLMSCSARIPIYAILISAFIPSVMIFGFLNLQAFVFTCMYFLGIAVAIPVAWIFKKTLFKEQARPFLMELPPYKIPSLRIVLARMVERGTSFLKTAGTLILAATIIVWALSYWPSGSSTEDASTRVQNSYLGTMGKVLEPVVEPIGWDWKVGVAILASFPAREVVISSLGVIYNVGEEEGAGGLGAKLKNVRFESGARKGQPVFTLASALALMVFFALCCQCASTLVVTWRETKSWFWPALTFTYMTLLAYFGALGTACLVRWFGG